MAEGRYMNPLTDYGFKKLFSDKEVMTAFLTDLLEPKSPIAEIQFLDKELTAQTKYERGIIYDLYCKAEISISKVSSPWLFVPFNSRSMRPASSSVTS